MVQLRDHAVCKKSLYLMILMELGAADLHEFLSKSSYALDVKSIAQVWRVLAERVESLHDADIIHRDIKPQNFILVPTRGHCDTRVLGKTAVRREDFVFRLVTTGGHRDEEKGGKQRGDVELVLKDPTTNQEETIFLTIKLTDFGIAESLDADRSHLSVQGPNGTVVFMAPEAVRQTVDGNRKVSKRVDVWALGVMLYQMLHAGQTPFGHFLVKGGAPEALLAVASETVNREAMDFDGRSGTVWVKERARLMLGFGTAASTAGADAGRK